jgi:hypothetical protein
MNLIKEDGLKFFIFLLAKIQISKLILKYLGSNIDNWTLTELKRVNQFFKFNLLY